MIPDFRAPGEGSVAGTPLSLARISPVNADLINTDDLAGPKKFLE